MADDNCPHKATRIERSPSKNPVRIDYVRETCLACGETQLRKVVADEHGKDRPLGRIE